MSGRQKRWRVRISISEEEITMLLSARSEEEAIEYAREKSDQDILRFYVKYKAEEVDEDE